VISCSESVRRTGVRPRNARPIYFRRFQERANDAHIRQAFLTERFGLFVMEDAVRTTDQFRGKLIAL
jgi:hypothetical protein